MAAVALVISKVICSDRLLASTDEGHSRNCSVQLEHDRQTVLRTQGSQGSTNGAVNYTCLNGTDQPHAYNLPGFDPYRQRNLTSGAECEVLCTAHPACVSYIVADCTTGSHWHDQVHH
jgi:hypothetical protein